MSKAMRRIGAVAVLAAVVACGGGGGDDDGDNGGDKAASVTIGTTVVKVGETKTVSVTVGQALTATTSEATTTFGQPSTSGEVCSLTYSGTVGTGLTSYSFTIGAGTTLCTLEFGMTGGKATVILDVP